MMSLCLLYNVFIGVTAIKVFSMKLSLIFKILKQLEGTRESAYLRQDEVI